MLDTGSSGLALVPFLGWGAMTSAGSSPKGGLGMVPRKF